MSLQQLQVAAALSPEAPAAEMTAARPFPLKNGQEEEVLDFLSANWQNTFYLAGLVRDNGLESPLNRGTFYGCRDESGELSGVALMGHATVFETRSAAALDAFARLAQEKPLTHLLAGQPEDVARFWDTYADQGRAARLLCREMLFVRSEAEEAAEPVEELRRATQEDLQQVVEVQAEMAFEESGVNPLEADPEGFRRRCFRRIEMGRVWVLTRQGRLVFKADVMAETPEAAYLEGVWVNSSDRGRGVGSRCIEQLTRQLLFASRAVCLLVNEQNVAAQNFYRKAGFTFEGYYDTIYLRQSN